MTKFKNVFNWIFGLLLANLGVCLCTKSDLGLSMIGAVPYIYHLWLREALPWFTQGTAEYVWEAVVLIIMCIVIKQFKPRYLLSFLTALLAGFMIDGWLWVLGGNGAYASWTLRITAFCAGTLLTSLGIAFIFHTTMPVQVYELCVMEISEKKNKDRDKCKYIFDITFLVLALVLSLVLTHGFHGIGVGTLIITFVNAPLIHFFSKYVEKVERIKKE